MAGQERRKHARFNFSGAPIMVRQDAPIPGVTMDISIGGPGLILAPPESGIGYDAGIVSQQNSGGWRFQPSVPDRNQAVPYRGFIQGNRPGPGG